MRKRDVPENRGRSGRLSALDFRPHIGPFGVPAEGGGDIAALRDDGEILCARIVHQRFDQLHGNSHATRFGRDESVFGNARLAQRAPSQLGLAVRAGDIGAIGAVGDLVAARNIDSAGHIGDLLLASNT